jgi:hypothetical protein
MFGAEGDGAKREPVAPQVFSSPQKIDRIYKMNKIRRKKINPVNLVNPVYFPCS